MATPTYDLLLLKIPVSDIAASAAFYRDVLGWEEQFSAPEYGWAQFQAGSLAIALYHPGKGGGDRAVGGDLDFHLQTADLNALAARLQAGVADIGTGVVRGDDNWGFIHIIDPDGNIFKVFGPQPK